jgi:archaellum component FlaC
MAMTNAEHTAAIEELQKQVEELRAMIDTIIRRIAPVAPMLSE